MSDVIFIGDPEDAARFRHAGIRSFAPARDELTERVLAERNRCRVLAMTKTTLKALPRALAQELCQGVWPRLAIVPERAGDADIAAPILCPLKKPTVPLTM